MSKMKKVYKQIDSLYLNGVITNCAVDFADKGAEIGVREVEERKTLGGTMLVMKNDGFPMVRGMAIRLSLIDDDIKWVKIRMIISDKLINPENVSKEDIQTFEGKLSAGYYNVHAVPYCSVGDVDLLELLSKNKNKFIHMEVQFCEIVKMGLDKDDLREMLKTQPENIFNIENNLGLNREYITGPYKTWEE